MNIGKSINLELINQGKNKAWLADQLKVTRQYVTVICKSPTCSGKMLDSLCEVFGMKASDFVALGE